MGIHDVDTSKLIEKVAVELKDSYKIKAPEWSPFVKTGHFRERPPTNPDWYYIRMASILRKVFKLGPIGVSKLRRKYGGKKNRGVKPGRSYKGSGKIIRSCLQQLEEAGLLRKEEKEKYRGRDLTKEGKELLNKAVKELQKDMPKKAAPKEENPKEDKKQAKAEKKAEKPKKEEKTADKKEEKPKEEKEPEQKQEEKTEKDKAKKEEKKVEEKEVKEEPKEEKKEEPKKEPKKEEVKPKEEPKAEEKKEEKAEEKTEETKQEVKEDKEEKPKKDSESQNG